MSGLSCLYYVFSVKDIINYESESGKNNGFSRSIKIPYGRVVCLKYLLSVRCLRCVCLA